MKRQVLSAVAGLAVAFASNAADETFVTNGVTWTYVVIDATAKTVNLKSLTPPEGVTSVDASQIPWTFTKDDVNYTVTQFGVGDGFKKKDNLTGVLDIPDAVTSVGGVEVSDISKGLSGIVFGAGVTSLSSYQFKNQRQLKFIVFKGKLSLGDIKQAFGFHKDTVSPVDIILLKNGTGGSAKNLLDNFDCTKWNIFIPSDTYGTDVDLGNTSGNVYYYGSDQAFDLTYDGTANALTIVPKTADSLTNTVAWAKVPFKSKFGFDSKFDIPGDLGASVTVTEAMVQDTTFAAPPWYLTFAAKSQAQLDNTLDAIDAGFPIVVDVTGFDPKEEMIVPEGRSVAVRAPSGTAFKYRRRGIAIKQNSTGTGL